ncbi:primosomal protein N' [Schleiferilactobacillus harbinensis]|uniref:primosomal protein N' n=1 Tax=Schleiferilactobacillus harbinensis TaxID=304207 RepID=UPI001AAF0657|nr:primosomal protein N' [Schleiferilactobacillus harbinensis]MBO3091049.1 primosomal protein N' [Schleiferilactobacillus harbinensis]
MTQVAQVVVDVATRQTDQPYDYAIPDDLVSVVTPGMRVVVPFGRRCLQGFVVGIQDHAAFDGKLKPIQQVMDLEPALDHELLALSKWVANTTFAFWITTMQTMLPAAMRAKYARLLVRTDQFPADDAWGRQLFGRSQTIPYPEDLTAAQTKQLRQWADQDAVRVEYKVKNQARAKTRKGVHAPTAAVLAQVTVPNRAKAQQKLLTGLQQAPFAGTLTYAQAAQHYDVSEATIHTAEEAGWLQPATLTIRRNPLDAQTERDAPKSLTPDQTAATDQFVTAVTNKQAHTFLLEGVTGSGKTEVYLQTIQAALDQGRTALMLVPEIALTPQMVHRVYARFGTAVAVLHSGLSDGEKYDEWRRIQHQQAKIVVGARSAVFAPLTNIGVIIIDEEHESSYKQDDSPRYHARNVALHRAKTFHCPVILGSATPSLESRARAEKGVYTLVRLPERINERPLPPVHIIDMRQAGGARVTPDFSPELLSALENTLAKHEQSVLMLNRRGYSAQAMCRNCGWIAQCPNCDISLTVHLAAHKLVCHYCGHEAPIPTRCPVCHSDKIRFFGTGTEKIEDQLQKLLPTARILRMDADSTRKKGGHARILRAFGSGQADILLGTQMIAKGLDFPTVTLVGVINADTALGMPDFRASERTFQLLTQVAGRAGRGDKPGAVIIQTYNPDHYAIQLASHQDYESFFRREMVVRHQGKYPPYYYTVLLTISAPSESVTAQEAYRIAGDLKPLLSKTAIVLGPTPRSITRVNNRYYYQILVKFKKEPALGRGLHNLLTNSQSLAKNHVQVAIDFEPQQIM